MRQYFTSRFTSQGDLLVENESENEAENNQDRTKKRKRVKSLDAFRGVAIVVMIFVNYGGGGYYFFAQ